VNRALPAQALQRVRETGVDVLGVLANQPVRRGSGRNGYGGYGYGYGYGYGEKAGYGAYAEAAERREATAQATEQGADQAEKPVRSRNGKGTNKRFATLKASSQRLMHWLDERE
jgi:hypothetical protein